MFVSFQDWALRSEEQSLLIERILVLIRNVLQVPANPEAECRADNDASVHDQVIWALHQSGILDLVLFIISSSDENQFHLHCLEIVCLLYREQVSYVLILPIFVEGLIAGFFNAIVKKLAIKEIVLLLFSAVLIHF